MMKIIVPSAQYDIKADNRILIPFIEFDKIGFVDQNANVVVKAKYSCYEGEMLDEGSLIIVAENYLHGYERKNSAPAVYCKPIYGLMNSKGEEVVELKYFRLFAPKNGSSLYAAQNMEYQSGAIDEFGNEVIPFGKYHYVDQFYNGHARITVYDEASSREKWGMINESGNVIIPPIYDSLSTYVGREVLDLVKEIRENKSAPWEDINLD